MGRTGRHRTQEMEPPRMRRSNSVKSLRSSKTTLSTYDESSDDEESISSISLDSVLQRMEDEALFSDEEEEDDECSVSIPSGPSGRKHSRRHILSHQNHGGWSHEHEHGTVVVRQRSRRGHQRRHRRSSSVDNGIRRKGRSHPRPFHPSLQTDSFRVDKVDGTEFLNDRGGFNNNNSNNNNNNNNNNFAGGRPRPDNHRASYNSRNPFNTLGLAESVKSIEFEDIDDRELFYTGQGEGRGSGPLFDQTGRASYGGEKFQNMTGSSSLYPYQGSNLPQPPAAAAAEFAGPIKFRSSAMKGSSQESVQDDSPTNANAEENARTSSPRKNSKVVNRINLVVLDDPTPLLEGDSPQPDEDASPGTGRPQRDSAEDRPSKPRSRLSRSLSSSGLSFVEPPASQSANPATQSGTATGTGTGTGTGTPVQRRKSLIKAISKRIIGASHEKQGLDHSVDGDEATAAAEPTLSREAGSRGIAGGRRYPLTRRNSCGSLGSVERRSRKRHDSDHLDPPEGDDIAGLAAYNNSHHHHHNPEDGREAKGGKKAAGLISFTAPLKEETFQVGGRRRRALSRDAGADVGEPETPRTRRAWFGKDADLEAPNTAIPTNSAMSDDITESLMRERARLKQTMEDKARAKLQAFAPTITTEEIVKDSSRASYSERVMKNRIQIASSRQKTTDRPGTPSRRGRERPGRSGSPTARRRSDVDRSHSPEEFGGRKQQHHGIGDSYDVAEDDVGGSGGAKPSSATRKKKKDASSKPTKSPMRRKSTGKSRSRSPERHRRRRSSDHEDFEGDEFHPDEDGDEEEDGGDHGSVKRSSGRRKKEGWNRSSSPSRNRRKAREKSGD